MSDAEMDADIPNKPAKCTGCGEVVGDGCNECAMCAIERQYGKR